MDSLVETFNAFKNESKRKENNYIETEIDLQNEVKELKDIVYKLDFSKHFVPQLELATEQAFWLQNSNPNTESSELTPVKMDVPSELPKVSLVNESVKKLKFHLVKFDSVVKKRTTPFALTEDFSKCFVPQLELSAEQTFWLQNSNTNTESFELTPVKMDVPSELPKDQTKCMELKTELAKKIDHLKINDKLQQHCISLELEMQLNNQIFQQDNFHVNQYASTFTQLHEISTLQAQVQAKDIVIRKMKERIKMLSETDNGKKVKKDFDEMETINIELEHSVSKLFYENENLHREIVHLKQLYNDQFDSIKKSHAQLKGHNASLIDQMNSKTIENADLKNQLHEKDFVTTIAPGMFKIDLEPFAPKLLRNRDAHIDYLKHTQENADILRDLVEHARALRPLDSDLDSACKYAKRIQEVLVYVTQTCPSSSKLSEKKIAVKPINKKRTVTFAAPLASTSAIKQKIGSNTKIESNHPTLTSTGVKDASKTCRSKPKVLGLKRLQRSLELLLLSCNLTLDKLRNRSRIGINKWYQSFCFEKFDLEVMEFESAQSSTTVKLPILKLGEYETWALEDFWINKAKIETMSIDDLYNNFKIVEQSVKKSIGASS
ncbi:hypothetical protein Tco_0669363, partial [Tanacetum coccineum]